MIRSGTGRYRVWHAPYAATGGSSQPAPSVENLNIGDDFYATIYYPKGGKLLEATDSGDRDYPVNVQLNNQDYASVDSSDPRSIWHFIRHGDDGSYKIINEYYNYCLDVKTGTAKPEQNVGLWHENHDGAPERWFITNALGNDSWYNLVSALDYPQYTMDVYNGSTSSGANVQIYYRQEGNAAQQFNIVKKSNYSRPAAPAAPTFRSISVTPTQTVISWNSVPTVGAYDSREYTLNIYNKTTGQYVVSGRRIASTSYTAYLPAGDYRAEISAVNMKYRAYSSGYTVRDFTVDAEAFFNVSTSATAGGTARGDGSYPAGNTVTVTASPQSGYHFVRWAENGVTVSTSSRYRFTVRSDRSLTAVFEQDIPLEPEATDAPVRIVPTNIQADSVVNYEGYGSLVINGDFGIGDDGEYTIYDLAQLALIDREGALLFAYRDDPVGDGGEETARFRYDDGVVSLALDTPYISGGGIPQYYRLDGSKAFPLETTDDEYTDEYGWHHDWTSWTGSPMCDGYAAVIEKLYSEWSNGWSGGVDSLGDNRTLIIDQNGTVTCELPEEYNKEMSGGGVNLWYFSTKMSLGGCGEGLFAFADQTIDYDDDWSSTTEVLGYMDPTGRTVIDLAGRGYMNAWPFHEGFAAVKDQSGKIGFIDKTGALVIPCAYENVSEYFIDGLCAVQKDGKWGYIGKSGNAVIPFEYDNAYGAGDGLASVVKDGKCGLVDYENNAVVPLEYDDISSYVGGVAYGIKNDRVYLITEYNPDTSDTPGAAETLPNGVKFVPFACTLGKTGNTAGYELQSGRLPHGLELDSTSGKISGVPLERGVFQFTVGQEDGSHDKLSYQLIIEDNTNSAVQQQSKDYPITKYVGAPSSNNGFLMTEYRDESLVIDGPYDEFQCMLIDGVEMSRDEDYTAQNGSTILNIYADAFENLGEGTHTIAVEFLDGGNVVKQASQNYTLTLSRPGDKPSSTPNDSEDTPTYRINISSRITDGSVKITPTRASERQRVSITIKANSGYKLDSLTAIDSRGNKLELTDRGNGKYTFTMPASQVSVDASFVKIEETPTRPAAPVISFTDVSPSVYYADAVAWAVEKGITAGTGATTFSPDAPCTRAQIVTFLWRAAGSPAAGGDTRFADVTPDTYYYDAVAWAVANGITSGTGADTFSPDAVCTRGQAVALLYRAAGSPAVSGGAFTDVAADAYYADAVQWAVDKGVTAGTGADTFSPDVDCTRAQIVTFLYRDMA